MKKYFAILFAVLLALTVISCKKEDPQQDPLLGTRWVSEFGSELGGWDCSFCCLEDNRAVWTQITKGYISDIIPGGYEMEGTYELSAPAADGTYTVSLVFTGVVVYTESSFTLSGTFDPQKTTMSLTVTDGTIPVRLEADKAKPLLFKR